MTKQKCKYCGEEYDDLDFDFYDIETPNCMFRFCIECAVDIENLIEDFIKKKEDKKLENCYITYDEDGYKVCTYNHKAGEPCVLDTEENIEEFWS